MRWQKWSLGVLFLAAGTFLGLEAIKRGMDGMGIGFILGGLSTGVAAVVYGNVQEHRAKAAAAKGVQ